METARLAHWDIASKVPDVLPLTSHFDTPGLAYNSYLIPEIRTDDYIPVDSRCGLKADFDNIEALSTNRDLQAEFDIFRINLWGPNGNPLTQRVLFNLPDRPRDLAIASLFAVKIASEFFGNPFEGDRSAENRERDGWLPVDPLRPNDTLVTKNLSGTADSGACLEYSIFTRQVLSRLGENVALAAGFNQMMPSQPGVRHAFLVADGGQFIIDPYWMALLSYGNPDIPTGIHQAIGETFLSNPGSPAAYADLSGLTANYSASPIEAMGPGAEAGPSPV